MGIFDQILYQETFSGINEIEKQHQKIDNLRSSLIMILMDLFIKLMI